MEFKSEPATISCLSTGHYIASVIPPLAHLPRCYCRVRSVGGWVIYYAVFSRSIGNPFCTSGHRIPRKDGGGGAASQTKLTHRILQHSWYINNKQARLAIALLSNKIPSSKDCLPPIRQLDLTVRAPDANLIQLFRVTYDPWIYTNSRTVLRQCLEHYQALLVLC